MSNPDAARRLALWAIELSEFDIQYRPRTAIKGQVVANFIAKFTHNEDKGAEGHSRWSVHTDGSSNRHAGGAGVVLLSLEGDVVECMIRLDFPTTNNEAEYEALVAGLDLARATEATSVVIYCDSHVITNQINGDYECKGERMKLYLNQVRKRVNDLQAQIIQIPRGRTSKPTALPKLLQQNIWSHMVMYSLLFNFLH